MSKNKSSVNFFRNLVKRKLDVLGKGGLSKDNFHNASAVEVKGHSKVKGSWLQKLFRFFIFGQFLEVGSNDFGRFLGYDNVRRFDF